MDFHEYFLNSILNYYRVCAQVRWTLAPTVILAKTGVNAYPLIKDLSVTAIRLISKDSSVKKVCIKDQGIFFSYLFSTGHEALLIYEAIYLMPPKFLRALYLPCSSTDFQVMVLI